MTPNQEHYTFTRAARPLDVAELATTLKALPALPGAARHALRLASGGEPALDALHDVIRTDAALSAKVLSIVNSSRFGLRREVRSVRHAVSMLGSARVLEAVLCAALGSLLPGRLAGYGMATADAWTHNVATGVLAEQLAHQISPEVEEDAFTAGLLHDAGKLAISELVGQHWPELAAALDTREVTFVQAERAVLGAGHPEVGEHVLRAWELPEVYVAVARHHHEPDSAPGQHRTLVGLVHVATALAHTFGFGADAAGLNRQVSEGVRARLGISRGMVELIVATSLPRILELSALTSST